MRIYFIPIICMRKNRPQILNLLERSFFHKEQIY